MTPIVKLVFGADYDKTRLTEYAAVLGHARRIGVARGGLAAFLDSVEGGIKGVVAAERAARAPATPQPIRAPRSSTRASARRRSRLPTGAAAGDFVVLLARAGEDGDARHRRRARRRRRADRPRDAPRRSVSALRRSEVTLHRRRS